MHSSSKNYLILKYAQKYAISIRIAHSHNTGFQTHNVVKICVGNIMKERLMFYATNYLACSKIAGDWLFGKKAVETGKVKIIKNGIDIDRYRYNPIMREKKRKEIGVTDNIVIGNVGRFVTQKNHTFLIEIFAEVKKKESKAVLLLAGIGDLMEPMKEKAKELGLDDSVIFLGFRTDVNELIQAMDLFLMPSLYEGFPVTAVEAQASGLPCILSDSITKEAALIEETVYIDLKKPSEYWAKHVVEKIGKSNRENSYKTLKAKGFDIKDMVISLENIYNKEV
mgnify:FL=1